VPKKQPLTINKSVAECIAAFSPDNPRIHSIAPDGDVIKTARSLLFAGWCELPSYNQANNTLIGGHGRVLACEYLIQQNRPWFEEQWTEYQRMNPQASERDRLRFAPKYWLQVPSRLSELDEPLHKTMLLRLNATTPRGTIDPQLKGRLLAGLKPEAADLAVPDAERRAEFLAKFGKVQESIVPQQQAEELRSAQQLEDVRGVIGGQVQYGVIESSDEERLSELKEPDVPEGGANVNADPKVGDRKQTIYPLCIILSEKRWQGWELKKSAIGLSGDSAALVRLHPAFREEGES